jgi:anti-sigma factor ChrR (cupin superfamily)
MTHPSEDTLLLLAYDELSDTQAADIALHVSACSHCRARLAGLDRARVAADLALGRPTPRRLPRVAAFAALAAAAVLAIALFRTHPEPATVSLTLPRYAVPELAAIDSLLTRLEQEKLYAIP